MDCRPAQRWLLQYFWILIAALLTLLYVLAGSVVASFVTTLFGFKYDVLGDYMRSFVRDDVLMGISFLVITITVPLICCILIIARNNSIITADIGNRVYFALCVSLPLCRNPVEHGVWRFIYDASLHWDRSLFFLSNLATVNS